MKSTNRIRREDAIADGLLIDVTESANKVGIPCEVALTLACWQRCVGDERKNLDAILESLESRFCPSGRIPIHSVEIDGTPDFLAVVLHEGPASKPTLFRLGVIWELADAAQLAMTVFVSEAWWQSQDVHQA